MNGENIDTVDTFVKQSKKNLEMAVAVKLYRYQCELNRVEEEIEENKPIPTYSDNKVKRAIIDGTVNAYRRDKTQKLSKKKKACLDKIVAFKDKCKNEGLETGEVSEESLRRLFESAFKGDIYGLQKHCFAMILCFEDESENDRFLFGNDTLFDVSRILFGDAFRLSNIKEELYDNFKELSSDGFWQRNKYFFIGTGISLALVAVLTPLTLGMAAASSAVVTSCLAQIGHCAPGIIGTGIAAVTGMAVMGTAVIGGGLLAGLGISELIESKKTKEAFRSLKPQDLAALLAIKATLMGRIMPDTNKEKYKEELDGCLRWLNDFRADAEYMLIVEKNDAENSKKKIDICNRFVNRLASIAGI